MTAGESPVVDSALLRAELVRLRHAEKLTQEKVGRALDWHPSKLIRIEGGKSSVATTDLRALLSEYGVTDEDRRKELEALANGARKSAWWNEYRNLEDDVYLQFIGYEAGASVIRHAQNAIVPGPLQTEEYAEVILSAFDSEAIDRKATLRRLRQEEMDRRESPPERFYVLDEALIWRHIGVRRDPEIMSRQLQHILDQAEHNDLITVRVVPFSAGAHAGLDGPFTLLEFEGELGDQLYLEGSSAPSQTQSTITGDDATVAEYKASFESIFEESLTDADSLELIREASGRLGRRRH